MAGDLSRIWVPKSSLSSCSIRDRNAGYVVRNITKHKTNKINVVFISFKTQSLLQTPYLCQSLLSMKKSFTFAVSTLHMAIAQRQVGHSMKVFPQVQLGVAHGLPVFTTNLM